MSKNQGSNPSGKERRQHQRVKKNFVLSYFERNNPDRKYDMTQVKNISKGGMCFITNQPFDPNTILGLELKTPYLSETTFVEARVVGSEEKAKGILFETRVQFEYLNPQADYLLDKIIELFKKDEGLFNG